MTNQAPVQKEAFVFPVSFAQQRLWFLNQLTAGDVSYNLPGAVRIVGPIDVDALERSLAEIVRRHETLRTRFVVIEGEPRQVVEEHARIELDRRDLCHLDKAQRQAETGLLARAEVERPFDLARGPLIRISLLRLAEEEHVLLMNMHHIISDGWSISVLVRELSVLYEAFSAGRPSPLPELPIQYADYSVWQREFLRGEVLEKQLAYWKQQMGGAPPLLDLPTDRPRPAVQTTRGAQAAFLLEPGLLQALRRLSQEHNATLYMLLLAAFEVLLFRYSGQTDILVGIPLAGRTRTETEGLIGFFVNTLVIRSRLSPQLAFLDLLERVKETTLEAYAHQQVPFEKLVEELAPERNLGWSPFFQVMFSLQNTPGVRLRMGTAELLPFPLDHGTSKFELSLAMDEGEDGLRGSFEYNTDLFDRETIVRMIRQFEILVRGVVEEPEQEINQIALVDEHERERLEEGWRGPEAPGPETIARGGVASAVAAQAARRPDAPALRAGGEELTYGDLEQRASAVARRLRAAGVRPAMRLAVCLENAAARVIAMLGAWKVGAAVVPFEGWEPEPRLARMLEDTETCWGVVQEAWQGRFPRELRMIGVHDGAAEQEGEEAEPSGEDLACVAYQSGFGAPEGVLMSHAGVQGSMFAGEWGWRAEDRVALTVSFAREYGLQDVFGALSAGACVIELEDGLTPGKLARTLRDSQATVLLGTAGLVERLVREFPSALKTIRMVICEDGPEAWGALQAALPEEWRQRVWGTLGAREAGGRLGLCRLGERAPLEQVAAGARIYLLDERGEPTPEGMLGEICFALPGIPRKPGARMYRSGTLGRRAPEGRLEQWPRRDGRLMLNGVRVQAEEIEAVLQQHPTVQSAVIVARPRGGVRGPELVGLVVAQPGQTIDCPDLWAYLRERLPALMLPRVHDFFQVTELARTADGELDRVALARTVALPAARAPYVAPRDPVEQRLAAIWEQTLGIERVGVHDNFFRMGGHSLLATQVVARISDAFQMDLALRRLFEEPTVEGLAKLISAESGQSEAAPRIRRAARTATVLPS